MLTQTQSENINELVSALSKAQGEINPAIKDSKNPFFKSNYADLSSVWNVCKEVLPKNGLAVIQTTDVNAEGKCILITTLAHSSGQWMRSCLPILNEKGNAQGLGAAITYTRRYGLSAIVGVTCDEDDDGNAACIPANEKKSEPKEETISEKQLKVLENLFTQCDDVYVANAERFYKEKFKTETWADLPKIAFQGLYDKTIEKLKGKAV
jgi:hypothetical protein